MILEGADGWRWDVPKECRFNSAIIYGTMTDSRDGQTYKTVKIGDQIWMAENLNYADSTKTPSLLKRNWCYNNKAENCAVAERLYTWAAAIDSVALYDGGKGVDCGPYVRECTLPSKLQGICPSGWHLPTQAEWSTLLDQSNAGKVLKSQTGWYNGNRTDVVGFSALPAGRYAGSSYFDNDGYNAYFWSATNEGWANATHLVLYYSFGDIADLSSASKLDGFSVRCLKD